MARSSLLAAKINGSCEIQKVDMSSTDSDNRLPEER